MKLTERKIETLTVGGARKDRLVFDDTQRGLAVRGTAGRSRRQLSQYTLKRQTGPAAWRAGREGRGGRRRDDGRCGEGQEPGSRAEGSGSSRVGKTRTRPPHARGADPGLGAAASCTSPTAVRG